MSISSFALSRTASVVHQGGVIAYPTEAVFGLGCDPLNASAVYRLLQIKQRPVEKGLILIASDIQQLSPYVVWEDDWAQTVIDSWPGPHTWLLPARDDLPYWINGGLPSVACRVTAHPIASALCEAADMALISTSANRAGQPPAMSPLQVKLRCPGVDRIVYGNLGGAQTTTSIRDARSGVRYR